MAQPRKTKKKSAAQLDREIAAALVKPPAPAKVSFPPLQVTKIYPEGVDEWYGVAVRFDWAGPFDYAAYKKALSAESKSWFDAHPRQMHVGTWPLEERMADHIRREIGRSPEWAEFWTKPHKVRVYDEYADDDEGSSSVVTLPKFSVSDIDQWDVHEQGGNASASSR